MPLLTAALCPPLAGVHMNSKVQTTATPHGQFCTDSGCKEVHMCQMVAPAPKKPVHSVNNDRK